ncbi:MAG: SIR2 family protein [Gammaproteobacteria bacterium AqS3]|nr:SIR2 family protein [Gammaproteobacteria bacterium AqS3]
MAEPSNLPCASRIAEICFDKYRDSTDSDMSPELRLNLEALAEHFSNEEQNGLVYFIENLVPWDEFASHPNFGHSAIADLLITRAAVACLSCNFDELIERGAQKYGADFRGSLDGEQAVNYSRSQAPLLKLHGCLRLDRISTVWTQSQLDNSNISDRIEKNKNWMRTNLSQKDLLVVGFWSDWCYLNQIIADALQGTDPKSVTVIDLLEKKALEEKAPELWALLHQPNIDFAHVRGSGAEVLDELRRAFSESYLRQLMAAGRDEFEQRTTLDFNQNWLSVDSSLSSEDLYSWRRDAEGVPNRKPATKKCPDKIRSKMLGCFHLLLRKAGAQQQREGYTLKEHSIRVINGAGESISSVAERFPVEPPASSLANIFVAVGAEETGMPGNIIGRGSSDNILRTTAEERWLTFKQAQERLEL